MRTEIAPTQVTQQGATRPAETTGIADGHKIRNNGSVYVYARNNNGAATRTITFQTSGMVLGELAIADLTVTLDISGSVLIGPFPPKVFNQSDDMVYVDYQGGGEADVRVRVMRLEP